MEWYRYPLNITSKINKTSCYLVMFVSIVSAVHCQLAPRNLRSNTPAHSNFSRRRLMSYLLRLSYSMHWDSFFIKQLEKSSVTIGNWFNQFNMNIVYDGYLPWWILNSSSATTCSSSTIFTDDYQDADRLELCALKLSTVVWCLKDICVKSRDAKSHRKYL